MNPRISAVMIGVKDIKQARDFYAEGLGCPIKVDTPGFVSFDLGDGSSELTLYPWNAVAADAGVSADGSGFRGFSLHYIVSAPEEVDDALARAERAGAKIIKPAHKVQWGYFGYFADPDGYLWKVATQN